MADNEAVAPTDFAPFREVSFAEVLGIGRISPVAVV
jgi:hypothetical protein